MTLTAGWIWSEDDPRARNVVVAFRRSFRLEAGAREARLHISADARYRVFVNGTRLGEGPPRNYHAHYEYDSYDVTRHLRPGVNVIAAAVSHWGEGTFQHMVGRAGLLAQLDLDGQPHLGTDGAWKARRSSAFEQATPRIACQLAWEEQFDARREEHGWTEADFDDAAWAPAVLAGPAGMAPWGTLTPSTIPFLTDEPAAPVRAWALGVVKRPEVVAAVHAGPYLAPGDVTANRPTVDGLIATTLRVPQTGEVALKRCSVYGGEPPRVLVDGRGVDWQAAQTDYEAVLTLEEGAHAVLIDWHGKTHDMDFTLTASGPSELAVESPLAGEAGTWAIATGPGEAREAALKADNPTSLMACGAAWRPVAGLDTPAADVYMDMTASVPVEATEERVSWPIAAAPAGEGQARHFLIDFGRLLIGWLELEIEAPAGTKLDLLGFEAIEEGRRQMTAYMNNTLRYVCGGGRERFVSMQRRGLRYVLAAVHGNAEEAVLHAVGLRLATYPWDIQGAFRCADARLNQIWEMCAYTLRLCSEDTFTDCPTYEQTLWTGDACHSDVLVHQVVHGDPRLPRRVLRMIGQSLERLPIVNAQVPGDWENDLLPNWSWLWAIGCENYYQLTGDEGFAREIYPAMAQQASFVEEHLNEARLLELPGFWHLLDWAKIPNEPNDVLAHESCLAAAALRATATLAAAAGEAVAAEHWRSAAESLAQAVNREFWREAEQGYADLWQAGPAGDSFSQPTNVIALLTGVAQGERAEAVAGKVVDSPPGWVPAGSPWTLAIGCWQAAERGEMTKALQVFRDRWGEMLDKGATTAWETFPGWQVGWWTRSWCHAWAALPAYVMQAYVLGVRPLEPGYRRALIAPQLGDLSWAEGRVPTPQGPIAVRAARSERGLCVQAAVPRGVRAEVRLPAGGRPRPSVAGAEADISEAGEAYVIALRPGTRAEITAPD